MALFSKTTLKQVAVFLASIGALAAGLFLINEIATLVLKPMLDFAGIDLDEPKVPSVWGATCGLSFCLHA